MFTCFVKNRIIIILNLQFSNIQRRYKIDLPIITQQIPWKSRGNILFSFSL